MTAPAEPVPTYVARLTPPGAAAIATLALRGPLAWPTVREMFRPVGRRGKQLPMEAETGQIWLGRLGNPAETGMADEVVVAVKRTRPVPWVEVHCHGGQEVVRFLMEVLEGQGMESCSWQNLEERTTGDPIKVLAAAALPEARTVRTAAILLDQFHGAFGQAIAEVRAALQSQRLAAAQSQLAELTRYCAVGRHLTQPWKVVIAGAPNVGKSTLVNALAGYQRSIVAATPGTTRDVVTTLIALEGWPVELADTAGLRSASEEMEQVGMARAKAAAARADLCLWVLDHSTAPVWPASDISSIRHVVNKIDLPAGASFQVPAGTVSISAKTGAGVDGLIQAVVEWLIPEPPLDGAPVPFTPGLCNRVEEACRFCASGQFAQAMQCLA